MDACSACGKPGFTRVRLGDGPFVAVCLDHYIQLQGVENEKQRNLTDTMRYYMAASNEAAAQADAVIGFGFTPRFEIPTPSAPSHHTAVSVSGGQIGVLNTGAVNQITANLGAMPNEAADAKHALERFVAAVVQEESLSADERNTLLDQLELVTQNASTLPQHRRPAIVGPVIDNIAKGVGAAQGLATLWITLEPLLKTLFKLP